MSALWSDAEAIQGRNSRNVYASIHKGQNHQFVLLELLSALAIVLIASQWELWLDQLGAWINLSIPIVILLIWHTDNLTFLQALPPHSLSFILPLPKYANLRKNNWHEFPHDFIAEMGMWVSLGLIQCFHHYNPTYHDGMPQMQRGRYLPFPETIARTQISRV